MCIVTAEVGKQVSNELNKIEVARLNSSDRNIDNHETGRFWSHARSYLLKCPYSQSAAVLLPSESK